MIMGYARVSTQDQLLNRQLDQLKSAGCDKIFQEKITGTKKERPELDRMLEQLREDDTVIVSDLTRLSRSTKDLFWLMDQFEQKKVKFKSLKESWADTTTPQGRLMFTIFAGISQFERDLISQRTKEGLAAAKLRGKISGRPRKEKEDLEFAKRMYESKEHTVAVITQVTGVSKASLYRYLKE